MLGIFKRFILLNKSDKSQSVSEMHLTAVVRLAVSIFNLATSPCNMLQLSVAFQIQLISSQFFQEAHLIFCIFCFWRMKGKGYAKLSSSRALPMQPHLPSFISIRAKIQDGMDRLPNPVRYFLCLYVVSQSPVLTTYYRPGFI